MDPSSSSPIKKKPSTTTGYTRIFLLKALALTGILGVLLIVLRLSGTAHQETAVATNPMPVVNEEAARPTVSALSGDVCHGMQEQNLIVKTSIEKDYDVVIDFVNQKLAKPREVYEMIIRITNEISKAKDLSDRDLENISKKVSTGINPVTLTNMSYYNLLKVTIGKDTYVLKRISKMHFGGVNDTLITKFDSPYIIKILMTFTNGAEDWTVMEYVGPTIPTFHEDFTEEEIRLLIHNCFMGLDAIHKGGYYHNDLYLRNIVSVKNDKGETAGFKIIDLGMSEVRDSSQMTPLELYDEVKGILWLVKDYLKQRVRARPKGVGYMEAVDVELGAVIYNEFGPVNFLEEDYVLADFVMTATRWVSKPASSISDLMKHQYFAGASADPSVFGVKKWSAVKKMPSGISGN